MAGEHTFESKLVEEFYNKCHGPDGRFCSGKASRAGAGATKGHGSGKTEPGALKLTEKYGTRRSRPGSVSTGSSQAKTGIAKKGNNSDLGKKFIKYKADKYGSGKTNPAAKALTDRFGTRGARPRPKKKREPEYGSGKTDPEALKLTQKYGTRRG